MKKQHVLNCTFSSWYNQFRDVTIKSRIISIPDDVLQYLLADGLVLPEGSLPSADENPSSLGGDEVEWDTETTGNQAPSFPKFQETIKKAIKALGGSVIPKLNWSSPKDATWIAATNTMKCTSPADVFLLLKSSDFISHDLTQPFDRCSDWDGEEKPDVKYELVLRRWHEINPGGEYRCFVDSNKLIGISQRHHSCFFPHISEQEDTIIDDIQEFFENVIQSKFADESFVFDVYRKDEGKLYLVDFNPFCETTDGLLFEWKEFLREESLAESSEDELPVFRYIRTPCGVQPSPYQHYGMPTDFVHLSTGQDPHKLVDFLNLKTQSTEDSGSSDDDLQPNKAVT